MRDFEIHIYARDNAAYDYVISQVYSFTGLNRFVLKGVRTYEGQVPAITVAITTGTDQQALKFYNTDEISVSDLCFSGPTDWTNIFQYVMIKHNCNNFSLLNCSFENIGAIWGYSTTLGSDPTNYEICNNVFMRSHYPPVSICLGNVADKILVINNTFIYPGFSAIELLDMYGKITASDLIRIKNNLFYGAIGVTIGLQGGIYDWSSSARIDNNIFSNGHPELYGCQTRIINDVVHYCTEDISIALINTENGTVLGDAFQMGLPVSNNFINPCHLGMDFTTGIPSDDFWGASKAVFPTYDGNWPDLLSVLVTDNKGNPRPGIGGGAPDIGAIELQNTAIVPPTSIMSRATPICNYYNNGLVNGVKFNIENAVDYGPDGCTPIIYYTKNGSIPTLESSNIFNNESISLGTVGGTVVKYFAVDADAQREVVANDYHTLVIGEAENTIESFAEPLNNGYEGLKSCHTETITLNYRGYDPVMDPAEWQDGGCNGVRIYYTQDGTNPTLHSAYVFPGETVNLTTTGIIRICARDEFGRMELQSHTVSLAPPVPVTSASVTDVQCFTGEVSVSLGFEDGVGTIYYTLDGTVPSTSSPVYVTPLQVAQNTLLRFAGYNPDCGLWESTTAHQVTLFNTAETEAIPKGGVEEGAVNFYKPTAVTLRHKWGRDNASLPKKIYYRMNNEIDEDKLFREYTAPISITNTSKIEYKGEFGYSDCRIEEAESNIEYFTFPEVNYVQKNSFPNGNLVRNWSFEKDDGYWTEGMTGAEEVVKVSEASSPYYGVLSQFEYSPYYGEKCAHIYPAAAPVSGTISMLKSVLIPIKPNTQYSLSLVYCTTYPVHSDVAPQFLFFKNISKSAATTPSIMGSPYGSAWFNGKWEKYSTTFTSPGNAEYCQLVLVNTEQGINSVFNPHYWFDAVQLNEGTAVDFPVMSIEYHDGLQRNMQIHNRSGNEDVVVGKCYDASGRLIKTTKVFQAAEADRVAYAHSLVTDPEISANHYYDPANTVGAPDAEDYAYGQNEYEKSALDRVVKNGEPGNDFRIGSGHEKEIHYAGVLTLGTQAAFNITSETDALYGLLQTRDENGNITNAWQDKLGRTIQKESFLKGISIKVTYEYDYLGNLLKTIDPNGLVSQKAYTTSGLVSSSSMPDKQYPEKYLYDRDGNLRFIKDANNTELRDGFMVNCYDGLGRNTEVYLYSDKNGFQTSNARLWQTFPDEGNTKAQLAIKKIYDALPEDVPLPTGMTASDFHHTAGRLVCDISLIKPGGGVNRENGVFTYYSYDIFGNVEFVINNVPGLADKKTEYSYNRLGQLVEMKGLERDYIYTYDELGRLSMVNNATSGKVEAKYEYWPDGSIKRKELGQDAASKPLQGIDYRYTIRGWLEKINDPALTAATDPGQDGSGGTVGSPYKDLFGQQLGYTAKGSEIGVKYGTISDYTAQFNGNIAWQAYNIAELHPVQSTHPLRGYAYVYDELNRMNAALGGYRSSAVWHADHAWSTVADYDDNGNIKVMKREFPGQTTANVLNALSLQTYYYNQGNNQLAYLSEAVSNESIHPQQNGNANSPNYTYDANGNMITDASKGLTIEYDWRNLPILFSFAIQGKTGTVQMIYNANGDRVAKIER
ncbi:MAG: hypothetical protein A2293_12325 [Elusimicrobia bacterium RIFOXYB2_FULL_49_7]|nr:MAG: hypothetical protein A2293_12325 [Elusimicrobia bacterium RIFOXYB2_FULL_49_7]